MGALPFIETELRNAPERPSIAWMFVHKKDQRIIGEGGISPKSDEFYAALIGYHIIPEYRKRGYGLEATRAIVDYALTHPSIKIVKADTLKDGWASIRILQKLGFEKSGESDTTLHWQHPA
jgi:[ribosomal protein S5]-alanine N-acetyltransferase